MLKKYYYLPLTIILVITLIVGSFLDFQINSAVFSSGNSFAIFMAAVGEYPGYFIIAFFGAFLLISSFKFFYKNNIGLFILTLISGLLGIGLSLYYQGNAIGNANGYNLHGAMKIIGFSVSLIILSPAVILGIISARKNDIKEMWQLAFGFLLGIAITIVVITIVKEIMHRPRFRLLTNDASIAFKNWWEAFPNYKDYVLGNVTSEEFKSFPSGHVGTSTVILSLQYIPMFFGIKINRKTRIFLIISAIYPLLLAYTRMLCGAHFLSDVSMGGLIGCVVFAITHSILYKKLEQIENKQ